MKDCFFQKKIEARFYTNKSKFFPPKMLGIAQNYLVKETIAKGKEYEQFFLPLSETTSLFFITESKYRSLSL